MRAYQVPEILSTAQRPDNGFEWLDNGDGIYVPAAGDAVVDMGVRGMIPSVQ
mgnify:CR=1 FL=1